mgnify:FL=1
MKLIFENWRKFLNEQSELIQEVRMEDVKKRFESKKFKRAVENYNQVIEDERLFDIASKETVGSAAVTLLAFIPRDIDEKDKAEALNWLVSLFIRDYQILIVLTPDDRAALETFFQIKKQNLDRLLSVKQLAKIDSIDQLQSIVDDAREPYGKHLAKKRYLDAGQGKHKIHEDEEYVVYIPTNKGAACELGKGTQWCTAAPGLDFYEQYHSAEDPLIIFKHKTDSSEDVQIHFGSRQYMNVDDLAIDGELLAKLVSRLRGNKHLPKPILKKVEQYDYREYDDGRVYVSTSAQKVWWLNGELHREDGPALIHANGSKWWYLNGERHREDGPALIHADGTKGWYLNGELHREDGPAVIYTDGSKFWYLNGELHREDGPAEIGPDGTKQWWLNGKRHREDGPAVIRANGKKQWYLNGKLQQQ